MNAPFTASAPGSLMLMGEHAVLHGQPSLVCAVNRRIRITLTPRPDRAVTIRSALGRYSASLDLLMAAEPFRFVTGVLSRHKEHLKTGMDIQIDSEFSHKVGLGSSAAVTVVMTAALFASLGGSPRPRQVFDESLAVVRQIQGLGSGADVAASVFGGIVHYRADPVEIRRLQSSYPLTVIYSGSKKPTVEVVKLVEAARASRPEVFDKAFEMMGQNAKAAATAIEDGNWRGLGELMNISQGLMDTIGVSNAKLSEIVYALRADPGIFGSKISGSGLGDCVIGLGRAERTEWPYDVLPVEISAQGLKEE